MKNKYISDNEIEMNRRFLFVRKAFSISVNDAKKIRGIQLTNLGHNYVLNFERDFKR